ncbi:unnamed protein product [Thelazia callipaeda]|uniref:Acyl_transf_3 domain-containing protein n=1 Tax=Thelazia callipaeda TaxID=103827 RepID=A0A0N5D693_THECL|nr:unnamed protein product [Thelazia callipaeda]
MHSFLNAYDSIQEQRDFFYKSFATSTPAKLILSRDRSEWHHRLIKCLHVPAETVSVHSEYPFIYCNAYKNLQSDASAAGLCLPDPCLSDIHQLAQHWASFVELNYSKPYETVECTRSRHQEQWYHKSEILANFIFNNILHIIVVCASVYDVMRGSKSKSLLTEMFLGFSAKRNFNMFIGAEKSRKLITCIFGLRVIATVWVIVGHSSVFIQDFLENLDEYREIMRDNFFYQLLTNFFLSVDIFFLLSATLTSYAWFQRKLKKEDLTSFSFWFEFYWNRIVRLWPVYASTLINAITTVSIFYHRSTWKLEDQREKCKTNWWKNLLFINSFIDDTCLPWTWYIGTDFIFYLIAPIYLLSFNKSRTLGLVLSVSTILLSAFLNIIKMLQYRFPPTHLLWVRPPTFHVDFMKQHYITYIGPQYRIGPYIVGILLGYLLVYMDKIKLSKKNLCCCWIWFGSIGFASLFGLYPALQGWDCWPYYLFYGALHRTIWAFAIGWLIFVCFTGNAYYLNRILSSPIFAYFSGICYSTYLCHIFLIFGVFLKEDFPIEYHGIQTLLIFVVQQVILSSIIAHLTAFSIEHPFINMNKTLWSRRKLRETNGKKCIQQRERAEDNVLFKNNLSK